MLNLTSEPIYSYADDSTLYSSFSFKNYSSTQQVVDSRNYISFKRIFMRSSIGVREIRSNSILIYLLFANCKNIDREIAFQDVAIFASSSFTLLGIYTNSKLSCTDHKRTVCNRALRKMRLM